MISDNLYKDKYLKYKNKYLVLKGQIGGVITDEDKQRYLNEESVTFPDIVSEHGDEILTILEYLKINKNLKSLTFENLPQILNSDSFNDVFLPELQNIFSNKHIEQLNISGDKEKKIYLNDDHLPKLVEILRLCKHLKKIYFNRNKITIKGYPLLMSALMDNALTLKTLNDSKLYVSLIGNPIIVQKPGEFNHRHIFEEEGKLMQYAVDELNITLRLR